MITKIKAIKSLAVFKNFDWDTNLLGDDGNVMTLQSINIIYGRNYSGKTTLSRLVRAFEIGSISINYENPQFELSFDDGSNLTQSDLNSNNKKIRVFNEDFVKDNLRFVIDPEEGITPFAILGGNAAIELEIRNLKDELGNKEIDEETGFI